MADYDSDSSLEESYVQLGYFDGPITNTSDLKDWHVSRVGGSVITLPIDETYTKTILNDTECQSCGSSMILAVQVYAPLEGTDYERSLYVFLCPSKACCTDKSARVFRAVFDKKETIHEATPSVSATTATTAPLLGNSIFGGSSALSGIKPPASQLVSFNSGLNTAEKSPQAKLAKAPQTVVTLKGQILKSPTQPSLVFPQYLTTSYEYVGKTNASSSVLKSKVANARVDAAEKGERYEVQRVPGMDVTSMHFLERMTLNGQSTQCIRYEVDGTSPLFYSDKLRHEMTHSQMRKPFVCSSCGSHLRYELQLMPTLENALRDFEYNLKDKSPTLITVLVYTCSKDCHDQQSWKEEKVFLEWDN